MTIFQTLMNLIDDNEDLVDFEHKGIKDLTVIQGRLFDDIISTAEKLESDVDKKSFIKKAVREVYQLNEKDLVIIKQKQIVIKVLENIQRNEVNDSQPSITNRFNGFHEEDIEKIYENYFDSASLNRFIKKISNNVFNYLFIRKQITNDFYENNIYSIIQNHIANELTEIEDKNAEFKKGFSGYIFRVNFVDVFSHIADKMLEAISYRDEYMTSWIKYYNGQVIIKRGKRFEAPSIINNSGQKYNPSAIFGTIAMWFKTRDKLNMLKKRLSDVDKNLEKLRIDNLSPLEYKEELLQERKYLENYISEANERIKELLDKRVLTKDQNEVYDINDEIQELRLDIKEDRAELEDINFHVMDIDTISAKRLEEDKTRLEKDVSREEKALNQNFKVYQSVQSALVKALTSKRKPI